ncbi:pyruvate:ferredoxin (flavodoxin) oxidoreductase [Serpentinicella sp. ANB-PHB4]|uniref:pyruvate:ferredoxin (flavodoxin) oxidoreductase n=1 Tax=Serpentinicella sp. ANB-PHB4 TaxID=3074076 RepID=UPI00285F9522|nr:pyruvate:ferredoxin (flavodoxin) oxidoreductase [Serpentinicella sp. ANB-PHB4]MDR5659164.1 pyruvate:ferredoxin (flavodoxin) oxidoreductase [Serpentinicella sp. ANB-PHB4]
MARTMKTMDGNAAAAHVSYAFTDVAAIYPITPSSNMAENVDEWSAYGKKNVFGQRVKVVEMQSEAGAAGAVHGSLASGALTTTYTASQGLLLMIPNMYKIAGELLPGVFHVSARALAGHALSIFGDHSDVMATRQTGCAMIASGSVQEVMDIGGVAHLAAIKGRVPFVHFFDGFRTSHEMQKIEVIENDEFAELLDWDAVKAFRDNALNPEHPVIRGTAQNPDIFFQAKESANKFYDNLPDIVADYMNKISELTGRHYAPFNYHGAPDAEDIIIAMGSVTDTIEETVDYLVAKGEKVGVIKVHLYRPFSEKYFFDVLPESVKRIAVLDRTKEPGALGEPLYEDVRTMFYDRENAPMIIGGRFGLGSKDTTPTQIKAVFDNLKGETPKNRFTVGINDDVTNTSIPMDDKIVAAPEGTIRCKFWGIGSDGTVGANKNAIKIIGDNTDLYAQAYFSYDSKKSGGVTVSHLRFGKKPIKSTYLIDEADFVACHKQSYVNQYDLIKGLKPNGTFLLNTTWTPEELDEKLPGNLKKYIADNNIDFYMINATDIATEIGLGARINMIMESAFFKLAKVIPLEDAVKYMKEAVVDSYGMKGDKVVNMNNQAVDKGIEALVKVEVPANWGSAVEEAAAAVEEPDFIKNVLRPINAQNGESLPVSTFEGVEDGTFPLETTKYEKRCIAVDVPEWLPEHCIQCNQCSFVCPHAAIRPFLLDEEEVKNAPESFKTVKAIGKEFDGLQYRLQVSPLDCPGCGNCVDICPSRTKAIKMSPVEPQVAEQKENWEFATTVTDKSKLTNIETVKGSQYSQPLFEFSGACTGCGETPYVKLVTQLFGDRMMISNATGCSSIYGGSAPSAPYCTNQEGKGPAWANSLFEDNAEFGYGMFLASAQIRDRIADLMTEALNMNIAQELKAAFKAWLDGKDDGKASKAATYDILPLLDKEKGNKVIDEIIEKKDYLIKQSTWMFGGDGWAYDIGFGGLDHVIASGEDVNLLVMDTEVYSNTGGQSSKASPTASIAKFTTSGKKTKKKDLGMIAMSYGYVYVAQVAMGADKNQLMKAIKEAEAYKGPSVVIAYSPCIAHGINMGRTQDQSKKAVEAGYWHLYRFNPELKEQGKNPFTLDSKAPTASFKDFLLSEVRYASLVKTFPQEAEELFAKSEQEAMERYETYRRLTQFYAVD